MGKINGMLFQINFWTANRGYALSVYANVAVVIAAVALYLLGCLEGIGVIVAACATAVIGVTPFILEMATDVILKVNGCIVVDGGADN